MEQRRRFVFHADAAAISGKIIRPNIFFIELPASTLTVAGGRSVSRIPGRTFGDFVAFDSAATLAEGRFDVEKDYVAATWQRSLETSLTSVSHSLVEVKGLTVGRQVRLRVEHLGAELIGRGPYASGQPGIQVGPATSIGAVTFDDKYTLTVRLNLQPFQDHDTFAKLLLAADDPAFVKQSGNHLFMQTALRGEEAPRSGWLVESSAGTVYATIVQSIDWVGGVEFPRSVTKDNVVTIPDLGTLYFGELLISATHRRLTMLRMVLGSETGGDMACADVQNNGGWGYP